MYVSSSRVPNDPQAKLFTLRNINAPDSSAKSLNIGFEIGLRSDNSHITEWYNGTMPSDDGEKNRYLKGYGIYEESRDKAGLTLFDEGKILFKVKKDENLQEKLSGYYSANIYFHLIAEE